MTDLFVSLDDLSTHADAFSALAQSSTDDVASVLADILAGAGCWGTDEPGVAFESQYGTGAMPTLTLFRQLPVQLAAISEAMATTTAAYAGTESGNTDLAGTATTA